MRTSSSSHSPVTALYLQRWEPQTGRRVGLLIPPLAGLPDAPGPPGAWVCGYLPVLPPTPASFLPQTQRCPVHMPPSTCAVAPPPDGNPAEADPHPACSPRARSVPRWGNACGTRTRWATSLTHGLRSKRRVPRWGGLPCAWPRKGPAAPAADREEASGGSSQGRLSTPPPAARKQTAPDCPLGNRCSPSPEQGGWVHWAPHPLARGPDLAGRGEGLAGSAMGMPPEPGQGDANVDFGLKK